VSRLGREAKTGYNEGRVRRIPFTLSLALTILVTTAVTGTLLREITAPELVRWGVSAADLAHGRWLQPSSPRSRS
jgi:hypothetical protein